VPRRHRYRVQASAALRGSHDLTHGRVGAPLPRNAAHIVKTDDSGQAPGGLQHWVSVLAGAEKVLFDQGLDAEVGLHGIEACQHETRDRDALE
jgi:hypothetical protein